MSDSSARTFEVRHVQVGRALFAAVAAIMITFSADHSAEVGLAVFSGWAIATALVLLIGSRLAYPRGGRALPVVLGVLTLLAGMVGGLPGIRSTTLFFVLLITWALATGIAEVAFGIHGRRSGVPQARDSVLIGAVTIALGVGLLVVNPAYRLDYVIEQAGSFTLTGIVIGVGLFGGYAAIVAVFLAIAGFSPRREPAASATPAIDRSVGESA
ncbi:acyl-CoA synthetase [uncultured Microbacterium sp.]|uniref:acyl-CoA synthetase n=1 Tax=uncultured Microbacterium sp. TaxID=191216 RepID=UPI00261A7403|nr:acyl-CoA synthetase [uncultured Microbacterium sp.]